MNDFLDLVNEAYEDIAKLVVAQIFDSDMEKYQQFKKRCFGIKTGVDISYPAHSPEEVFYMLSDELSSRIQCISESEAITMPSVEYYQSTPVAEKITQAIENTLTDCDILTKMTGYMDIDKEWKSLLSEIQNGISNKITYTDVATMAVNKANTAEYYETTYELFRDCIERAWNESCTLNLAQLNICAKETDEIKNGIAYDVYHEMFDDKPPEVQQYIPNESDFFRKIDVLLKISGPLKECTEVDYSNEVHWTIKYKIYKRLYISEDKLFPKSGNKYKTVNDKVNSCQINDFLKLFCLDRAVFTDTWFSIFEKAHSSLPLRHYYLNVTPLLEIYKKALYYFVFRDKPDGEKRQRNRKSYENIKLDNTSLFQLLTSAEEIILFSEAYHAIRSLVILSCPNKVLPQHLDKCKYGTEIVLTLNDDQFLSPKELSKYNRLQEIRAICKAAEMLTHNSI